MTGVGRARAMAVLGVVALLAGCGARSEVAAVDDGYEVTVTTPDDGEVTLTDEPRRIGVLNGNRVIPFVQPFLDDEHVLVGYGNEVDPALFPWVQDELESFEAVDDTDGPNVEAYAGWDADLLLANGNLGDYWEPARDVAPLVQLPETDWRATVTLLGEIFQKPEVAEQVIADTEALIADARLDDPVTAAVLWPYQDDGTVGTQVLGAELPNFLADLGIEVAASETALDGYEDVSIERLGERLDGVDHLLVLSGGDGRQERFLADPVVGAIPVVADGRVTEFSQLQTGAGFPVNPLTVPVLIEALEDVLVP